MNREVVFARTLEKVKQQAGEQGNCISQEQVQEAFSELELSGEQLQMVYDYLVKHKIGIGAPVDADDYLTDEDKNYLQTYLEELEGLPVYTEGEIQAFTISAMAGESDAAGKLMEAYLRNVVDIAKLYAGQGVFLEDLIGEGNLALTMGSGMLGSLESHEEARGMLVSMVMNAMEDYIQENADSARADERVAQRVNRVADRASALAEEMQRKVTPEELSRETGLSRKAILDAIRISGGKIEDIEYAEENL